MISSKSKKVEVTAQGAGVPFFMPMRYDILTNDFQRQQPIPIDLSDLNGHFGMPINFTDKRGRIVPSLKRYWTTDAFADAVNGARDIE